MKTKEKAMNLVDGSHNGTHTQTSNIHNKKYTINKFYSVQMHVQTEGSTSNGLKNSN